MRKVIFLAIIVGGLAGLLRPQAASAQFIQVNVFAVKFVCGRQGPASTDLNLPAEPPVKPGNYATKINIELLSPLSITDFGASVSWQVSIPGGGHKSGPAFSLTQFQTVDITCAEIVHAAFPGPAVPPKFINGYVNVITSVIRTLAVTGVYTSQGCSFGDEGEPPTCTGPVSIEVVPETVVPTSIPVNG